MTFKQSCLAFVLCVLTLAARPALAANLDFTVNTGEPVIVDITGGTPRLALTVGSASRFATYVSGSGTAALLFRYSVQAGDFDADGVAVVPPVDLNGATIRDAAGNDMALSYVAPATGNVRVQTYTVAFATDPVTALNQSAVSLTMAKAPVGATFNYTITSSGGAGSVTGTGTVASVPQTISGIDVTSLPDGTLTASLTVTGASGTGAARTATVAKNTTAILDGLPTPAAAYGLRKLRSAYAGPLVQVRRSDNATQDIGALANGNLNETALTTFCGSSNCFVQTWYDQSGNGLNAVQPTAAQQPSLVSAGTILRMGTRPALYIAPANAMTVTGITWNAYTLSAVVRHQSAPSDVRALAVKRTSTANSEFFWFYWSSSGSVTWDQNGSGTGSSRFNTGFTPVLNTNYVYTLVRPLSGSNRIQYVNGVVRGSTSSNANVSNALLLTIGNDPSSSSRGLDGRVGEFIVWTSALSTTDRTALEGDQGNYYAP